jgi:DNA modification methylase
MKLLKNNYLELPNAVAEAVINQTSVRVAPHDFYKYPARFTPSFPKEIIHHFSNVGDTVIDPFCGKPFPMVVTRLVSISVH